LFDTSGSGQEDTDTEHAFFPRPLCRRADTMAEMIISKARTKAAANECNVSSDFYEALDRKVRELIRTAEKRATENGRKTIRPYDL
jgi:hypothetical protein